MTLGRLEGWAVIRETSPEGIVLWERTVPNIMPNPGFRLLHFNFFYGFPYANIYVAGDARPPAIQDGSNLLKVDLDATANTIGPTVVYTPGTLTTKYSGTIAAPASPPRTITKLGLSPSSMSGGMQADLYTVLDLIPAIVQNGTLTVDYYVRIHLPRDSGMQRWQFFNEAATRWMSHLVNAVVLSAPPMYVGLSQSVTYGRYFCVDSQARYGLAFYTASIPWSFTDVNAFADRRSCVRSFTQSFTTAHPDNNIRVGPFTALLQANVNGWPANDEPPTSGASFLSACFGAKPLAIRDGTISQVFKHPVGENLIYNGAGGALSQGMVEVAGPYRPDNDVVPRSFAYRAVITLSGDTDPGTEGRYVMERGQAIANTEFTSNPTAGMDLNVFWRSIASVSPHYWVAAGPPTCWVSDGRGGYWGAARQQTFYGAPTNRSILLYWRAGTNEEITTLVESDSARYPGLAGGDELVAGYGYQASIGLLCPPAMTTDGDGRIFWPKRDVAAGSQAIYVIDNRKPGRQYQRPSGMTAGGSAVFRVRADDEVHAMFPFVAGDVNGIINIVDGPNAGEHLIQTVNGPNEVTLSTTMLTDLDVKWHWKLITERTSSDGLLNKPRVLAFDQSNGRLWAFCDGGIQVSTDYGATWSGLIANGTGLSTTDAQNALIPDGYAGNGNAGSTHGTVVISKAGDIYWVDTLGGVNKYVGSGPGGTHSRITAFPGTLPFYGINGLAIDNVACHMPTAEGALWITAGQAALSSVWRINLDVAFIAGNLTTYSEPIDFPAGYQPGAVRCGAGGRIYIRQDIGAPWLVQDPATGLFSAAASTDMQYSPLYPYGTWNIDADGLICNVQTPGELAHFLSSEVQRYLWDDVAGQWRQWHGSGAQFDARYGTTNGGQRTLHAGWQPFKDGLQVRFTQLGGATPPTSEFVLDERFSWLGAWGVYRDNTQNWDLVADTCWAAPVPIIEDDTIRTVQGKGTLNAYWAADNTSVATQVTAALGSGTLPSLDISGRNYGWLPRRFSGLTAPNGPVPETEVTGAHNVFVAGLDLGAAQEVAKVRLHAKLQDSSGSYPRMYGISLDTNDSRVRLYVSQDNAAWTEVAATRIVSGYVTPPTEPDAGYVNVDIEQNDGGTAQSGGESWVGLTFDMVRAGLNAAARTFRYVKILCTTGYGESVDSPFLAATMMGSIACLDSSGQAIGVADDLFMAEMLDPDVLASQVTCLTWIQDRVGLSGKGGITTTPDAFTDGRTATAAIASGTFNTGAINPATDWLAYRHPATGQFVYPGTQELGAAHVRGGTTMVRIASVSSGSITVAERALPDNMTAVDWEVRRPVTIIDQFPTAGQVACDPAGGYLTFHDADIGKEFKIPFRVVVRRP